MLQQEDWLNTNCTTITNSSLLPVPRRASHSPWLRASNVRKVLCVCSETPTTAPKERTSATLWLSTPTHRVCRWPTSLLMCQCLMWLLSTSRSCTSAKSHVRRISLLVSKVDRLSIESAPTGDVISSMNKHANHFRLILLSMSGQTRILTNPWTQLNPNSLIPWPCDGTPPMGG
jgi:hypothetical protein